MTFRKGWWKDYRSIHQPAPANKAVQEELDHANGVCLVSLDVDVERERRGPANAVGRAEDDRDLILKTAHDRLLDAASIADGLRSQRLGTRVVWTTSPRWLMTSLLN